MESHMFQRTEKGDGLVLGLSVKENMTISSLGFFSTFFKIDKKSEKNSVDEYVEKFSIKTPTIDQKIKNLSGGNQQKVCLAKAFTMDPEVFIRIRTYKRNRCRG